MPKESSLISNIWTQRNLGIDLAQHLESITPTDIAYLCAKFYPFLQLINAEVATTVEVPTRFITATTGWIIHDYGEAISVAAPHTLKTHAAGSIRGQIETIAEIVALIVTKNWPGIELIAGTQMMQRLLWIEAKRYGLELMGYEPAAEDTKCYARLMQYAKAHGLEWNKPLNLKHRFNVAGAT